MLLLFHAALGRMYGDIGESALSAKNTSRAYQLRDRASDQERFFTPSNYFKPQSLMRAGLRSRAVLKCFWARVILTPPMCVA